MQAVAHCLSIRVCRVHPQILELTPAMAAFISDRDKSFPGVTSGVLIPRVRAISRENAALGASGAVLSVSESVVDT
jgi:hypothetical protein